MTVSHTAAGFTGTVDEVAWSKLMGLASAHFRVASSSDWALSVSGTTARTINIAAGSGYACGVLDSTTAGDTVAFATNSGGSNRYDALVATYTWGSDTVTFQVVTGTTSPPAVNTTTTVDNAKINRIPGVRYDALLAVVQVRPSVGNFASGDLFDMRPYGGKSGSLLLPNSTYLSLIDAGPGAEVYAVDTTQRWQTLDGSTWTWPPEPQGEITRADYTSGPTTLANTETGLSAFTITAPFVPSGRRIELTFDGNLSFDSASTYSFRLYQGSVGSTLLRQAPVQVPTSGGVSQYFMARVVLNTTTALTNQQFTVSGARTFGTGTGTLHGESGAGPCQYTLRDLGAV